MKVSLNHMGNGEPMRLGIVEILLNIALRVHHGRFACHRVSHHVTGMRQTFEVVLLEKHCRRRHRFNDTLWGMCRQVTCKKCGRPSWAGCGAHVEQVLGHVAKSDRCACRDSAPASNKGKRGLFGRRKG